MAASPALAVDPAQLDCPLAALSDAQREAAAEAMIALAGVNDARLTPLRAAAETCARQLGWSARATDYADAYHASRLAREGLRQRLTAAGVDIAPLERVILADRELLAALGPNGIDEGTMNAFVERNTDLVLRTMGDHPPQVQSWIGNFSGFVVSAEVMRRNFTAE